ncbi:MAG: DUF4350 domain-containing protein [Nocardioides sp.]
MSSAESPPRPGLLRRQRTNLLLAAGLAAGILVVVVLGGARSATPLDPDNPGREGAQALARVLADEGVDVTVVRSAAGLDETTPDASTTVLVTSTVNLGPSTLRRLRSATADALLVLTQPDVTVTDELGLDPGAPVTAEGTRPADCADADLAPLLDDLEITVAGGTEYAARAGCWFGAGGALVAGPEEGVLILGAPDLLRNASVLQADNAAAALRLLGRGDRLVWYVPDYADLEAADGVSLSSLLPDWIRPGLWLGALALLALVLWRGRRLGPLVTEPLPVVVKAIETTRSRGRLYRKVDDRPHATAALRGAARTAVAERLRVPATTDPYVLARDVARHLDRPVGEIAFLLHPDAPVPSTDHDLIALADALATLDREVRTR